ncbi:MAG: DUF3592 domain-containing protein [Eubacteriales bacterium]
MEYLFYLFGPFMLVIGIITLFKRKEFVKKSTVVNGAVIEIKTGPASKNRTAYYPVIEYFDSFTSNKEVYESNTAYESSKFNIGDKIELRYLNDGIKKQICLNNRFGIWGFSFMIILFGFIFSVFSFILLIK